MHLFRPQPLTIQRESKVVNKFPAALFIPVEIGASEYGHSLQVARILYYEQNTQACRNRASAESGHDFEG